MSNINNIKKTIIDYNLRPSKSLGQNFLAHDKSLDLISMLMDYSRDDFIIEIGPGIGALTKDFAGKCKDVVLIEKDKYLLPYLEDNFGHLPGVKILHMDAVKADFRQISADTLTTTNSDNKIPPGIIKDNNHDKKQSTTISDKNEKSPQPEIISEKKHRKNQEEILSDNKRIRTLLNLPDLQDLPDLPDLQDLPEIKLVSNLPYYASSDIVMNIISATPLFERIVLTVQKEFADRLTAKAGTPGYGIITVMANLFYDIKVEGKIPPHGFYPQPGVDSVIVRLLPDVKINLGELPDEGCMDKEFIDEEFIGEEFIGKHSGVEKSGSKTHYANHADEIGGKKNCTAYMSDFTKPAFEEFSGKKFNIEGFKSFLKIVFGQRRKILSGLIKNTYNLTEFENELHTLGISDKARAQELSPTHLYAVYKIISGNNRKH